MLFRSILLGGRVAEELVLEDVTTGAGDDIERATEVARKMVCEWGMSENMGPLTFGKKEEQIFLGREIAQHRDYSENTAIMIDDEVKKLVTGAQECSRKIISENLEKLHNLADNLLEREVLDGNEIDIVLKGEALPAIKKENVEPEEGDSQPEQPNDPAASNP